MAAGFMTFLTAFLALTQRVLFQAANTDIEYYSDDPSNITEIEVLAGKTASLPCAIEPMYAEDRVYMVLWFRQASPVGKPLYTFDVRGRSFEEALHWSDPRVFGARAKFQTHPTAALVIRRVVLGDEGVYRCRVDFKNSPTRNLPVMLNIVVAPHQVLLSDAQGRDLAGVIGPLQEGDDFPVTCELRGGRPRPKLTWTINNNTISNYEIVSMGKDSVVSRIVLRGAQRDWLNSSVRCIATTTPLMHIYERSARVEMNLCPLHTSIINKPKDVKAEDNVELTCVSEGSRPPAKIYWYQDKGSKRQIIENKETVAARSRIPQYIESHNETHSVSRLVFVAEEEHNGVTFKCSALNTALSVAQDDSVKLNVKHVPSLELSLGSSLNPNDIKEGNDAYLDCKCKANPKEYKLWWTKNGVILNQNIATGTIISDRSLVLQKLTHLDRGIYRCLATNALGTTESNDVFLRVQHAPVCSINNKDVLGAPLHHPVRVRCTVEADPAVDEFTWIYNNTGETFHISPARLISTSGTTSELQFTTASERDYGAFLCIARNSIGQQHVPCLIWVKQAMRPMKPRNCSVSRHISTSVIVKCYANYGGGMKQYFILHVLKENGRILAKKSAKWIENEWLVKLNISRSSLETVAEDEIIAVSAVNSVGYSDPVIFRHLRNRLFADGNQVVPTAASHTAMSVLDFILILAFLSIIFFVAFCACLWLARRQNKRTGSKRPSQSVVQVDAQGRRCLLAYPAPADKEATPDILIPKPDNSQPRVVLETADNKTYSIRETNERGLRSANSPPPPDDEMGAEEFRGTR